VSVARALGLGAISGLRSLSGPAFVSRAASRGDLDLDRTVFAFLGSPRVSKTLVLMELGELVGDKLPVTPSRTSHLPCSGVQPQEPWWGRPSLSPKAVAPLSGRR
jgi:uncharacterized membrane protein